MSPVAFLISPERLPAPSLTKGVEATALEALAYDGRLNPAEWVQSREISRPAQPALVRTALHDLPSSPPGDMTLPAVSELDWSRARWGVSWPGGPSSAERVALWALSRSAPSPEAIPGLIELALYRKWRFVIKAVAVPSFVSRMPEFNPLLKTALKSGWSAGIATLVSARISQNPAPEILSWFAQWSEHFVSGPVVEGALAGLPSSVSKAAACARWLKAWENKEDWSAEELTAVAQIVAAVGEPADVDGLTVAKQARQLLVSNASSHHVKKQVLDYVGFHRRHFGEGVDLAAAVASSNPPTSGWEQVLKTGRRAAVCANVLEKMGLGESSYRRTQGASLFWLEQAAVQRAEKARHRHWEKTSLLSALARRQSRMRASLEKQGWTNEELMAGLMGLHHTPWWPELRQLGFEWLIKRGNTPLVMEQACQGSASKPSLVAQLLDGCTVSIVPLDFLNTISPWFTRGESDPSIASTLLGVGCKTVGSAWLDDIKKQAWESPFDEWDKVEVKLAAMVSQAAQAGRLDVSSVDWECLGGMKPLAVQLKQYALESSLPAATPRSRPSLRM